VGLRLASADFHQFFTSKIFYLHAAQLGKRKTPQLLLRGFLFI
jgi:hypothetical protein